jgi:hypothetical protein
MSANPPAVNFFITEPIFMKIGVYIMAQSTSSNGIFHKSFPSVWMSVCASPYGC